MPHASTFMRMAKGTGIVTIFQTFPQITAFIDK